LLAELVSTLRFKVTYCPTVAGIDLPFECAPPPIVSFAMLLWSRGMPFLTWGTPVAERTFQTGLKGARKPEVRWEVLTVKRLDRGQGQRERPNRTKVDGMCVKAAHPESQMCTTRLCFLGGECGIRGLACQNPNYSLVAIFQWSSLSV
jgi:hypothetical protein